MGGQASRERLRKVPAVERILQDETVREALAEGGLPRAAVVDAAREVLEELRRAILAGASSEGRVDRLARTTVERAREAMAPRLVPVVNATGVVIHTNLGRAPLARPAVAAVTALAGYCNLEYDLAAGVRGHRHDVIRGVLRELTGAEDALVVNNNAAAVLLGLTALARGREVVVSRGELVEIGGAFRVPDVMVQSGAVLREVGTTNKTHSRDYEQAIRPETALLLKVHTSNYRILGFSASVPVPELVAIGRRHGVAVMEDLGSGCLVDLAELGLEKEPTVREAVASGADLVTFSADKLLGGPQAGILLGRREAVETCARHPLMRALRPDKLTLGALEATLALYRDPRSALRTIPVLDMVSTGAAALKPRAHALARQLAKALGRGFQVRAQEDESEVGGGALPLQNLPTWVVQVRRRDGGVSRLEARLRAHRPPVIARVKEDALVFDLRTLREGEDRIVMAALAAAREPRDAGADDVS